MVIRRLASRQARGDARTDDRLVVHSKRARHAQQLRHQDSVLGSVVRVWVQGERRCVITADLRGLSRVHRGSLAHVGVILITEWPSAVLAVGPILKAGQAMALRRTLLHSSTTEEETMWAAKAKRKA